jgi:hypothetical protein
MPAIHLAPGHRKDLRALTNGNIGSGELVAADTSNTWTQKRLKERSQMANGGHGELGAADTSHTWTQERSTSAHKWQTGGKVSSCRPYISQLDTEKVLELTNGK